MRIISKHRDYYDSALAFGHDEHVVFERFESEHRMDPKHESYIEGYAFMVPRLSVRGSSRYGFEAYDKNRRGFEFSYHPFTVAFCGKIYPGIEIKYRKDNYMGECSSSFAYDFQSYADLLALYGLKFSDKGRDKHGWFGGRRGSPKCKEEVEEYFRRTGEDHIAFFAEKRKPIAVCEQEGNIGGDTILRFNSPLSNVAFYKVFDAYTTFQELDMFISGVMVRDGNPMESISDEKLRDKKGFDNMSFKKEPTKKRK